MDYNNLSNEKPAAFPNRLLGTFRRISLGVKLPMIVIALATVAFLISTFLSVQTSETALIGHLQEALAAQAVSQADLIRSHLIWTRSMAVDLAAQAATVDSNESNQLKVIESTLANNDQIFGSTIAYEPYRFQTDLYYWSPYYSRTPDGKLRFTQLGNPDYNYFKWDWYTLPKEQRKPVLSPPYYDAGGGEIWMVTWSVPFFDANGKVKGVATADIAFSQTQDIVHQIAVGKQGYAFLIDKQGTLLGIGENGGQYQIMIDSMLIKDAQDQDTAWNALINAMVKGDSGFTMVTDPSGSSVFVAYQPIGLDTDWSLGLVYPQAELLQPVTQLRNSLILFSIFVAVIFAVILFFFTRTITRPLQELASYTSHFSQEQLKKGIEARPIHLQTHDELEDLANSFNLMAKNLVTAFETMEEKVATRTHSLQLAAEVGRVVSQVRALDIMLKDAAELIRSRFDLYYVQVYLIDPTHTSLALKAGTGTVGVELLNRNHKLPLNATSINGRAAIEKRSMVVADTSTSATFKPNPLLPHTRSEMAVPLLVGEKVVGVLDMQSAHAGSLSQETLPAFEALAGQLAIAIQNASLLGETESARAEVERQARQLVRRNWSEYLDAIHAPESLGFVFEENQVSTIASAEAAWPRQPEKTVTAPITVTGEPLGMLIMESENQSPEEAELVHAVARQVAQQIENLRIIESAERYRAEAEQASRRLTREGWKDFMEDKVEEGLGFLYDTNSVQPVGNTEIDEEQGLILPLKVRDESVGKMVIQGVEPEDQEIRELADAVAERLSAHIENLRLSSQIEKRAHHERILQEVTSRVSSSVTVETAMRRAVEEVGRLMGRKAFIKLTEKETLDKGAASQEDAQ
ncbi:MAG: GAF domain-containing protein [Chloroflexi bacterium]|nr:GAF domain-containing protein [Chloroflexota bacterium]